MINDEFVETAFTADEVDQAIAEGKRRGIQDAPCAFLKDELVNQSAAHITFWISFNIERIQSE